VHSPRKWPQHTCPQDTLPPSRSWIQGGSSTPERTAQCMPTSLSHLSSRRHPLDTSCTRPSLPRCTSRGHTSPPWRLWTLLDTRTQQHTGRRTEGTLTPHWRRNAQRHTAQHTQAPSTHPHRRTALRGTPCTLWRHPHCRSLARRARRWHWSTQRGTDTLQHKDHCTPPWSNWMCCQRCRRDTSCKRPSLSHCTSPAHKAPPWRQATPRDKHILHYRRRYTTKSSRQGRSRTDLPHMARCTHSTPAQAQSRTHQRGTACMPLHHPC
jgi:hypothetical protein